MLLGLVHSEFFFHSAHLFFNFCPPICRHHATGHLPKASRPRENEEATIDPDAVVNNVQQIISKMT